MILGDSSASFLVILNPYISFHGIRIFGNFLIKASLPVIFLRSPRDLAKVSCKSVFKQLLTRILHHDLPVAQRSMSKDTRFRAKEDDVSRRV